ncbi:MAG: SDR family NAD(P)-dependent oxidoreductase [Paludibacter sp.]|jgi:NAD(P)-dependent dehydrogenase (short-subunit alcohol dehydrogenase family)|nr:SDR family NAD(P)-dependent oxidoreductase [Paludibacter sp.]
MQAFSLKDKTILITGASSGIGRAMAIACSEAGATLIITGRNLDRLTETLHLLKGEGHTICVADLTKEDELAALVEFVPKLDGFVSNAGIVNPLMLQFVEKQDVDQILNTNAVSVIHLTRLLLQEKKLKKDASLVFTSSINGNRCAYIGSTLYAASKAMLTGFMKATALELAPKGIRVNCIEPGMIETDLLKDGSISPEELDKDKQKYPLKRYGKPEEVALAAVYLLSDATRWMTGSSIVLDGGYTLQ